MADHWSPHPEMPAGGSSSPSPSLGGQPASRPELAQPPVDNGTVYLVGAGPGDPELLTVRAWRLLRAADAILHDSLTGSEIIARLPDTPDIVDVGKRSGPPTSQEDIHDQLLARSDRGEAVVRLKGGDPAVFARGGEEAEYLAAEGVPFEVVPGVSSVLAAPSAAGIPLTHREHTSSFAVVTGHEDPTKESSALDWEALARTILAGGTLVILMGVRRLPENVTALRDHGVPADTPAAMVEKATWREERTVTGTLGTIERETRTADIEPPAVTLIGEVVGVRETVKACFGGTTGD